MILSFYGPSGSGKTETITKIIEYFKNKNYNIATIKHIPHEGFSIDSPGKDTWKFSNSGSKLTVSSSIGEVSFILKRNMDLKEIIKIINLFGEFDLILIEGYKNEPWIKKIKFGNGETKENTVMEYRDFDSLIKYIEHEIEIDKIMKKLPNFNCGECGFKTCRDLAEKILNKEKDFMDCRYYNPDVFMNIIVNNREIYLSPFVQNIVKNTIIGLLSSLKGVGKIDNLEIKMKF